MAKRIVVCSDGTGNTAIKGRGTNVFKVFESVDLNGHRLNPKLTPQVAIYDDGVGTEDFKPLKILGGDVAKNSVHAADLNVTRLGPIEVQRWNATKLPLEDASVDRIVSNPPSGKQMSTP